MATTPAAELNYGVLPETQLHLIVPLTTVGGSDMPTLSGLSDIELPVKYRFLQEKNGRTWFRLPVWLQKSWGEWTTYGGGGAVLILRRTSMI